MQQDLQLLQSQSTWLCRAGALNISLTRNGKCLACYNWHNRVFFGEHQFYMFAKMYRRGADFFSKD